MNHRIISRLVLVVGFAFIFPLSAQTCKDHLEPSQPNHYYEVDEQIVLHRATRLQWTRCLYGQTWTGSECAGEPTPLTWRSAKRIAEQHSVAGESGWRLPTHVELLSISENACTRPSVNIEIFPNVPALGWLWTSVPSAYGVYYAWGYRLEFGAIDFDDIESEHWVRFVREAPPPSKGG